MVDEQKIWDAIDQMRIAIPEEVKRAKRTNQERDRILAQAHEEATRIVELAREEAANLASQHEVAKAAETRAETILERARSDAESLRADADEYVLQVLSQLSQDLERALTEVRNGIVRVQQEHSARAPHASVAEEELSVRAEPA
jgi:cell division septum initiation protein DivIVA